MFARLITAIFKDRSGYVGRKLVAAWAVTTLTLLVLFFHPLFNLIFQPEVPLEPLLHSESFHLIIIAIWGSFFASDSMSSWVYNLKAKNDNTNREQL